MNILKLSRITVLENKVRIKNCIKTNSGTDVMKHRILAFFHSWCESKIVWFLSPPMACNFELLRPVPLLKQCGIICSSSLCVCVCVFIYVCIYTHIHNTRPLKFTLQVRCSIYMFTPSNMTLDITIFTQ